MKFSFFSFIFSFIFSCRLALLLAGLSAWGYAQTPEKYTFDLAPGIPMPKQGTTVAQPETAPSKTLFMLLDEWDLLRKTEEETGWRKISQSLETLEVLPELTFALWSSYESLQQTDPVTAAEFRKVVLDAADNYLLRVDVIARDGLDLPELMRSQQRLVAFEELFQRLGESQYAAIAASLRERCRIRESQCRFSRKMDYIFKESIY